MVFGERFEIGWRGSKLVLAAPAYMLTGWFKICFTLKQSAYETANASNSF